MPRSAPPQPGKTGWADPTHHWRSYERLISEESKDERLTPSLREQRCNQRSMIRTGGKGRKVGSETAGRKDFNILVFNCSFEKGADSENNGKEFLLYGTSNRSTRDSYKLLASNVLNNSSCH